MDSFACGFETRCFAPQTVEATDVSFRLIESRNRFLCYAYVRSFFICNLDVVRLISEFVKFSYLFHEHIVTVSKFRRRAQNLTMYPTSCKLRLRRLRIFAQIFEAVKFSGAAAST